MHSALLVAKRNNDQITALLCPRKPAFDDTRSTPPQYYITATLSVPYSVLGTTIPSLFNITA